MRKAGRLQHLIEPAALAAFAAAALAGSAIWGWRMALLAGFSFAAFSYCAVIVAILQRARFEDLPMLAARHDRRAPYVLAIGLAIDLAALFFVIDFLTTRATGAIAVALTVSSTLGAWVLLNMLFAIHYAHLYFADDEGEARQLDFPGEAPREFSDFIYFAFVIGMTFQVSDVAVLDAGMRRLVVAHSALAFMFSVFVLALAVNAVGNFI